MICEQYAIQKGEISMARADLLRKLFGSFSSDDKEMFIKTAQEIIDDERKKNHLVLADDLQRVLNATNPNKRYTMSAMKTNSAPNADKDVRLVEFYYS